MKNYYEILEVDSKASPEVIEKAYKTLVKKYHPDLQNGINKNEEIWGRNKTEALISFYNNRTFYKECPIYI